jgi:glucoamylase
MWAEQGPFGAALAAVDDQQRDVLRRASAGYVDTSDGWQDLTAIGHLTWEHASAGPGNVALMGELPQAAVLTLGFGSSAHAAATLALSSAMQPFETILQQHVTEWESWQVRRSER